MSDLNTLDEYFNERFDRINHLIKRRAVGIIQTYGLLHLLFVTILLLTLSALLLAWIFSSSSSLIALGLAFSFCISFFFFVLRIYYQARMPEQLAILRDDFITSCRKLMDYQDHHPSYSLTLGQMLDKLSDELKGLEYEIWSSSKYFSSSFFQKFSALWHQKEIHLFREMLLIASIDEYIKLVQTDPINVEVHAFLAGGYIQLSRLYFDPQNSARDDSSTTFYKWGQSQEFKLKFRTMAKRAIEEFKIIREFSPDDPWVYAQLAYSYCDLNMPRDEIIEYEKLLTICPEDEDALFRLGVLYFSQGFNAKGLRMYEKLSVHSHSKAQWLLSFYDAYQQSHRNESI